jgi:hypothetical protein
MAEPEFNPFDDPSVGALIEQAKRRQSFFGPITPAAAPSVQPAWKEVADTESFQQASSESKRRMLQDWVQRELNETMPALYKKKADQKAYEEALYASLPQYKTPTRTWGEAGMDTLLGVNSGLASIAEMVGNLVNADQREFEGDPNALNNLLNPAAQKEIQKRNRDEQSAALKDRQLAVDEIQKKKEAAGASQWSLVASEITESLARPQVALDIFVKQMPTMAALLLGGELVGAAAGIFGIGTRAVQAARAMGPLTPNMERAIAGKAEGLVARFGAMGPGGSILSAGDVRGNIIDEFEQLKDEQWERVPEYAARTAAGEDKTAVKRSIAMEASKTPAAIGALVGFISGATGLMPLGVQVARGLGPALGRGAAELIGQGGEEAIGPIGANVQIAASGAEPERGTFQDVGRTVGQALLGAGPGGALATVSGARPPEAVERGLPQPGEAQPPQGEPPAGGAGPATRRQQIAEAVAGIQGNITQLEADETIDPAVKEATLAALQKNLAEWQTSETEYENVAAAKDVRDQITEINDRADRILNSTLDDNTKQRLLAEENRRLERLNRLDEVSKLDENELEKYIDDREAALALASPTRGTEARINRTQLTEEVDHANALVAQRAFVKTPTETAFAARARDVFPQDKSGNYEFPTVEQVEGQPFQDALNTKRDIALALTNQLQTNPTSTNDERVRQIGLARRAVEEYRRIADIFRLQAPQLDTMEKALTQALGATILRRTMPERGTRIAELAAVIAAKNQLAGGQPMSYGTAVLEAKKMMEGMFAKPQTVAPVTGTPGNQAPTKSYADGTPTTWYDDVEAISRGEPQVRTPTPEELQALEEAKAKLAKAGFPMKVLEMLGLRIGVHDGRNRGVYWSSPDNAWFGLVGLNIGVLQKPAAPHGVAGTFAHEVWHAIDNAIRNVFQTTRYDAFMPGGVLRKELEKGWGKGNGPLDILTYPFAYDTYTAPDKAIELLAQVAKYYYVDPHPLRMHAPRTFDFMREVSNGLEALENPDRQSVADVIQGALSKISVPSVGRPEPTPAVVSERAGAVAADEVAVGGPGGAGAVAGPAATVGRGVLADETEEVRNEVERLTRALGSGDQASRRQQILQGAVDYILRAGEPAVQAAEVPAAPAVGPGEGAAPPVGRAQEQPAAGRGGPEGQAAAGVQPAPAAGAAPSRGRAEARPQGEALSESGARIPRVSPDGQPYYQLTVTLSGEPRGRIVQRFVKRSDLERVRARVASEYAADATVRASPMYETAMSRGAEAISESLVAIHGNGLEQPVNNLSTAYVGTGEGKIAKGWGLYFATLKDIARSYRDKLAWRQGVKVGNRVIASTDPKSGSVMERMLHATLTTFINGHPDYRNRPVDALRWLSTAYKDGAKAAREGRATDAFLAELSPQAMDELSKLALSWSRQNPSRAKEGMLYKVILGIDEKEMLDWDAPLAQQKGIAEKIKDLPQRIKRLAADLRREELISDVEGELALRIIDEEEATMRRGEIEAMGANDLVRGGDFYTALVGALRDDEKALWDKLGMAPNERSAAKAASLLLQDSGIPGTKYFDADSRAAGKGTSNYVVYDDAIISISQAALDFAQNAATGKPANVSNKSATARAVARLFGIAQDRLGQIIPSVGIIESGEIAGGKWVSPSGHSLSVGPGVRAWYDPNSNTIRLVADRIPKGEELAVLLHELFHKRGGQLLGAEEKQRFIKEFNSWKHAPDGSIENQVYEATMVRISRDALTGKTGKELTTALQEETLPYAIEEAMKLGVKWSPTMSMQPGVAGAIARLFNAMVRAVKNFTGVEPKNFSVADLINAAYGAAALETVPGGGAEIARNILQGREQTAARAAEIIRTKREAAGLEKQPDAVVERQAEALRRGFEYIPELATPQERAAGMRPSQAVPEDAGNAIMFSQGPVTSAVNKAAKSVYSAIIDEARAIKNEQQLDEFIGSQRLPADSKIPRIRDEFVTNWVDAQRPFYDWLRQHALPQGVWRELKLVPGRMKAVMQRYNRDMLNPLYKQVATFADKHKLDYSIAAEYLGQWATLRHIPEANAALEAKLRNRAINGDTAAARQLSINQKAQRGQPLAEGEEARLAGGLTDAKAMQKMAAIEALYPKAELQAVGDQIVRDFQKLKDDSVASGQLRPEWVKNFPKFKHYVALSGTPWDDTVNDFFGANLSENRLREREGRTSLADPAILTLTERTARVAAYEASVPFKKELNAMYEKMGLVGATEAGIERTKIGEGSRGQGIVWQSPDGERYSFTFADPKITEAIQSQNREMADNLLLRTMQKATGLFSRAVTQWTMAFALVNNVRDIQEKSVLIRSKNVEDMNGNVIDANEVFRRSWKNYINPDTWKAAYQIAFRSNNKADESTSAGRYANALVQVGGISTWGETLKRGRESLAEGIRQNSGKNLARVGFQKVGRFVENYNLMLEMVASLSVNAAMRDLNVDTRRAAAETLGLMNFRDSGAKTAWIRSLFAFFNPAVQSGRQLWGQLGTKRGLMDAGVMFMVSFALYNLSKMTGDDDEELGNSIDQRGSFEAERSLTFKIGDAYLKIPVGFGMPQFAWASAVNTARWSSGRYTAAEAMGQQVTQFLKTFSPVPPSEVPALQQPVNFFFKTLTPTVFKPAIDLLSDTNTWGQKLTAYYPDKKKFQSEQGRPGTPEFYKDLAEYGRTAFGIDVYPEQWQTLMQGLVVGPPGAALRAWSDRTKEQEGRPLDFVDQIPLSTLWQVAGVSRVIGRESRFLEARYYEQYNQALESTREFKAAEASGRGRQWLTANPERSSLVRAIETQETAMRPLVKEYNQTIRDMQNDKISDGAAQQKLEGLIKRKQGLMRRFLHAQKELLQYLPETVDVEEEE